MTTLSAPRFDALYVEHEGWLRDWLRSRTRCAERAADLAQDTFCRLIERADHAAPENPRPYLATIARRLLVDDIRRREVERAYLEALGRRGDIADPITPERIAGAVQLLSSLAELLAALPAVTRQAFLLRRLDGLSHGEIAARLNICDRTVKRHIAKAYAQCYAFAYSD